MPKKIAPKNPNPEILDTHATNWSNIIIVFMCVIGAIVITLIVVIAGLIYAGKINSVEWEKYLLVASFYMAGLGTPAPAVCKMIVTFVDERITRKN